MRSLRPPVDGDGLAFFAAFFLEPPSFFLVAADFVPLEDVEAVVALPSLLALALLLLLLLVAHVLVLLLVDLNDMVASSPSRSIF